MSKQSPLLFICHRIPFPPNKGDKIATFNLMKFLHQHYKLYVVSFIDDPFDRQYQEEVKRYCFDAQFVDICDRGQLSSGIESVLKALPVSLAHYRSKSMQANVDELISTHNINKVMVYSSGVAQFINQDKYKSLTRILNMTDIDSDKWRQYAENKSWLTSWIYTREYRLLQKIEQQYLREFDAVTLVTEDESALFRSQSPTSLCAKIHTVSNGVDTEYFNPDAEFDYTDQPAIHNQSICFTGAMDYWANVDAVVWFCEQVWPAVKQQLPELQFYIVGSKPADKVCKLAELDGVHVTGRVADVRPYIEASQVCVGPLRIARGIQNKMLEAMAMAKSVVMTQMAAEGILTNSQQRERITDDAEIFSKQLITLLQQTDLSKVEGEANRRWVLEHYSWVTALSPLKSLLENNSE